MSSVAHGLVTSRAIKVGILGAIVLIVAYLFDSKVFTISSPEESTGSYYKVERVTDGDTFRINMDGTDETVRLIGINTPEIVDQDRPIQCFGKEASARLKAIVDGELVRLEYDDSQSLRDTYGRLLAYAYLEDGEMVNRKMIAEGYAYEYTYLTPYKYQKEFRQLQTLAKTTNRGLWSESTCNGSATFSH
jgi:micrococcal nuclease